MAWGAEDIETFAAALKDFFGDGERHYIAGIVADFAGVEIGVCAQITAGNRALDWRALRTLVDKKIAARKRILPRLDVHVDAACGSERNQGEQSCTGERRRASLDRTGEGARPHMARGDPREIPRSAKKSTSLGMTPEYMKVFHF
jgi:hypothetical protein